MNSPGPAYAGTQGGEVWGQPGPVTDSASVNVVVVVSVFCQLFVHVRVSVCLTSTLKWFKKVPPANCSSVPKASLKVYEEPWPTLEVFVYTALYIVVVPPPFPRPACV